MGKDDGLPLQMVGKNKEFAGLVGSVIEEFLIDEYEGNLTHLVARLPDGRRVAVFFDNKLDIDSRRIVPVLDIRCQNIS